MKLKLSLISLFLITSCHVAFASSTSTCFDTDTKLMLHMNGADASTTFTDSSASSKSMTAVGAAQIDTAQSVFGGASGLFEGTTSLITTPDNVDFDASSDFTIDFRVRFTDAGAAGFFTSSAGGADWFRIRLIGGVLQVRLQGGTNHTFAWGPSTGTWYHLAIIRTSGVIKAFVDGTQIDADKADATAVTLNGTLNIGYDPDSTVYLSGWIDEFRFVNGTAVWTSGFTSPSNEYTVCTGSSSSTSSKACGVGVSGFLGIY